MVARWSIAGLLALLVAEATACSSESPGHVQPANGTPPDSGAVDPHGSAPANDAGPALTVDAAPPDAAPPAVIAPNCGSFPAATNLEANGSFAIVSAAEGPACTVVRPQTLGEGGVRHPVILWANGTGAPTALYQPALELWASHGFIVAAADAINGQGSGGPMLACLDYVMQQNATAGGKYDGKVCARAGATGHSQGGGGLIMVGRDPRILATAPLEPYIQQGYGGFDKASIAQQIGPMLLLSGELDDNAVPSVHQQPVFDKTNVPVFWAMLKGGDHYTVALGAAAYRAKILAWFRLHLLGDQSAQDLFYGASCGMCGDNKWIVQRKSIP